jgi:hypothetical protein
LDIAINVGAQRPIKIASLSECAGSFPKKIHATMDTVTDTSDAVKHTFDKNSLFIISPK